MFSAYLDALFWIAESWVCLAQTGRGYARIQSTLPSVVGGLLTHLTERELDLEAVGMSIKYFESIRGFSLSHLSAVVRMSF